MARTLNLGNVIAQINGSRVINISATQPVNLTQNGYNVTISIPNASQSSAGLMSMSDKIKLDGIQSSSVALGETSTTAYRGDQGKAAYDHSLVVTGNPHQVTKAEVGLSNVPNVATNDQTPTYTPSESLSALVSGEKLNIAFGKLATTTSTLISHTADTVVHITDAERGAWNNKVDKVSGKALSANDFTDDYKSKLDGIEAGAEVNEIYAADHSLVAGSVLVLSREIEELKKYCKRLEDDLATIHMDSSDLASVRGYKGFAYIDDAATAKTTPLKIRVDPALSGSQLYIQCITQYYDATHSSTNPVISSCTLDQYKVDQYGVGVMNGVLNLGAFAKCYIFVTTTGYVWNAASSSGSTIQANSGAFGSDGYPVNGVDFQLYYYKAYSDDEKPANTRMNENVGGYYDALALNGYSPKLTKYASTQAAITGFNNGDTVVIEDLTSLDYLLQTNYWLSNRWVRLTASPELISSTYNGEFYKEEMVLAV